MQQCLWWRHRFWNLWISQKQKNLHILRMKHYFFFKWKDSLITNQGLLYGKKYLCSGGNLNSANWTEGINMLVVSQCQVIRRTEYKNRHKIVGQYIHWKICQHYNPPHKKLVWTQTTTCCWVRLFHYPMALCSTHRWKSRC